jgi:hypothetical protein
MEELLKTGEIRIVEVAAPDYEGKRGAGRERGPLVDHKRSRSRLDRAAISLYAAETADPSAEPEWWLASAVRHAAYIGTATLPVPFLDSMSDRVQFIEQAKTVA